MSGAAAISAAKNRRSTGNIVQTTPNRNQVVSQPPQQRQQLKENISSELPKPANPMQALQLHEIRLNRYEKAHLELENSVKTLADILELNKNNVPKQNSENNNMQQFNKLFSDFNERISTLEDMFHHLKEDIFRVQTFAMETSLSVLKLSTTSEKDKNENVSPVSPSPADLGVNAPIEEPASNITLQVSECKNDVTLSLSQIVDSSQ